MAEFDKQEAHDTKERPQKGLTIDYDHYSSEVSFPQWRKKGENILKHDAVNFQSNCSVILLYMLWYGNRLGLLWTRWHDCSSSVQRYAYQMLHQHLFLFLEILENTLFYRTLIDLKLVELFSAYLVYMPPRPPDHTPPQFNRKLSFPGI